MTPSLNDAVFVIAILVFVLIGAVVVIGVVVFLIIPLVRKNIETVDQFYNYRQLHEHQFLTIAEETGWIYTEHAPDRFSSAFKAFDDHYPSAKKECFLNGIAGGRHFLSFEVFIRESPQWAVRGSRPAYHHFNAIMLADLEHDLPAFDLYRSHRSSSNVWQKYEIIQPSPEIRTILTTALLVKLDAFGVESVWARQNAICLMVQAGFDEPDKTRIARLQTFAASLEFGRTAF